MCRISKEAVIECNNWKEEEEEEEEEEEVDCYGALVH